ncbi:MAG: PEP-CTERM sorting domain-containing protein [Phycisphaerales bacterium]|nr:PEP-CTERM sorting domain-containing protein [Planctomycetota bacterium]
MKNCHKAIVAGMLAALSGMASADMLSFHITADNHYALYSSAAGVYSYHGGNELGSGGNPGAYNWSLPETYLINGGDRIFIAAWSDDSVAQGVLAQVMNLSTQQSLDSGSPAWMVYHTDVNRGDNDPHPSIEEIAGHVLNADTFSLWETPYVGEANGTQPWGTVPGIGDQARWMWLNTPGDDDPLRGGSAAGEMLIFSMQVPTPSSLALAGLGGLCVMRRRRS